MFDTISSRLWSLLGKTTGLSVFSIYVLIAGFLLVFSVPALSTEEVKPADLYERTRPSVVMVFKKVKCMITVPKVDVNEDLFDRVKSSLKKSGEKKPGQAATAIIEEFRRNPIVCLERSSSLRDFEATIEGMGSGFLATSRGHVITNAHVVRLLWADVLALVKERYMAKDFLRLITQMRSNIRELKDMTQWQTEAIVAAMKPGLEKFYRKYTQVNWTRTCKVIRRVVDANSEVQLREYPAEVLIVGSSIPGKDVAVLKIEAPRLTHCLPLGDESALNVGDQIYVIGYPAPATFHSALAKISVAEASMTRGIINAKKTAQGGWLLLQHDAATSKGSSGGPALDNSGKVIGIQTFGTLAPEGEKVQGSNFIVPVSIVKEFLERTGVRIDDISPRKETPGTMKPPSTEKTRPDTGDESGLETR